MVNFFATAVTDDSTDDTVAVFIAVASDDDLDCEVCDTNLTDRPAAYVTDFPDAVQSASTICLACLLTIATDFRIKP